MNKHLIYILLVLIVLSCSRDPYPGDYLERFKEYEESWGYCYDKRFPFPNDSQVYSPEYISLKLDDQEVLINDNSSGFEGTVRFESSWISNSQHSDFLSDTGLQTLLQITFIIPANFKQISLVIQYPPDSLNYYLQNIFNKQSSLNLPSAFTSERPQYNAYPQFIIGTYCFANEACSNIRFSSAYSLKQDQQIQIDTFSFKFYSEKWHYQLEYSVNDMEITNGAWNSLSKNDIYGNERHSDVMIENLLVNNLKCVIEFELDPD